MNEKGKIENPIRIFSFWRFSTKYPRSGGDLADIGMIFNAQRRQEVFLIEKGFAGITSGFHQLTGWLAKPSQSSIMAREKYADRESIERVHGRKKQERKLRSRWKGGIELSVWWAMLYICPIFPAVFIQLLKHCPLRPPFQPILHWQAGNCLQLGCLKSTATSTRIGPMLPLVSMGESSSPIHLEVFDREKLQNSFDGREGRENFITAKVTLFVQLLFAGNNKNLSNFRLQTFK